MFRVGCLGIGLYLGLGFIMENSILDLNTQCSLLRGAKTQALIYNTIVKFMLRVYGSGRYE